MIELITEVTAFIASTLAVVIAGHELLSKKKVEAEIVKKKSKPHLFYYSQNIYNQLL